MFTEWIFRILLITDFSTAQVDIWLADDTANLRRKQKSEEDCEWVQILEEIASVRKWNGEQNRWSVHLQKGILISAVLT